MSGYSFDNFKPPKNTNVDVISSNEIQQSVAIAIKKQQGLFVYNTLERMFKLIREASENPYDLMGYHNRLGNLSASIGGCIYYNGKPYEFGTRYYGYGTWEGGHTLSNPIYSGYPVLKPWRSNVAGEGGYRGDDVVRYYLTNYKAPSKGFHVVLAVAMPYASFFEVHKLFERFNALNPGVILNYIPIRMISGDFVYTENED